MEPTGSGDPNYGEPTPKIQCTQGQNTGRTHIPGHGQHQPGNGAGNSGNPNNGTAPGIGKLTLQFIPIKESLPAFMRFTRRREIP